MINKEIIKALVKIGNSKRVKELCEPNVMQPFELEEWQVIRTLKAVELFENAWQRVKKPKRRVTE